jgi:hypothetical protein
MHDWEDLGALVVVLLSLSIVGIDADDIGMHAKRIRLANTDQCLDFSVGEQLAQRFSGCVGRDRNRPHRR